MATIYTPMQDRILVKPAEASDATKGGILLPDSVKERPKEGIVMAVGPGKYQNGAIIPMTLKPGDRVTYGTYAGTDVTIDEVLHKIMFESDVIAVITTTDDAPAEAPDEE